MKKTQNLEMNIPEGGDPINITDITDNFETLDTEIAKKANSSGGDISNTTVKTVDTIAVDFPVPSAGESSKTFLGKVRKFIQDFIAIKDTLLTLNKLVNNGQTTASGFALDARYGKTLYDLYSQLNSDIDTYYLGVRVRNSCVRGFMEEITFTNGIGTFNISNYYKNFVYHSIVFGVVHVYRPDLDRYIPISFSYDSVDTNTIKVSAIFVNDGSYYSGKVWVPGTVFCSS